MSRHSNRAARLSPIEWLELYRRLDKSQRAYVQKTLSRIEDADLDDVREVIEAAVTDDKLVQLDKRLELVMKARRAELRLRVRETLRGAEV